MRLEILGLKFNYVFLVSTMTRKVSEKVEVLKRRPLIVSSPG